jgi:hypothetical protein
MTVGLCRRIFVALTLLILAAACGRDAGPPPAAPGPVVVPKATDVKAKRLPNSPSQH